MPIKTTTMMDIREQIAVTALSGAYTISEIAELFGVTRPTVYKYRDRYRDGGRIDLVDRSRAPNTTRRTPEEIVKRIVAERRRFRFGSKKIHRRLVDSDPDIRWPARSTIDQILRREGLVSPRRRRRRVVSPFQRRYNATKPGELTSIDFKGEFRLRRSCQWCHPLTMADFVSRYLLACEALPAITLELVWPVVERVFREHGLPDGCLADNGPPFGGHGVSRLSTFSVRLMELGIQPVFIVPGHPEQNGRHESMHNALRQHLVWYRGRSFREQQRFFDDFRTIYNEERPHEGIDMDRPAQRYASSRRPFHPAGPLEYPDSMIVRPVMSSGIIRWQGDIIFLSHALAGRRIGLEQADDQLWNVHLGSFLIGRIDQRERRFV